VSLELKPSVVVFDLDGTLVKLKLDVKRSKRAIISWLSSQGLMSEEIDEQDPVQVILDKVARRHGRAAYLRARKHILRIMRDYEMAAAKESEAREGAAKVLQSLRNRGYRTAVATNTHRDAAVLSLSQSGFTALTDVVVTRDDVERLKPSGDMLILLMKKMGVSADKLVFVGDSMHDMEAAREAGIRFFAVEGGVHSRDRLRRGTAVAVLSKLTDILEYL